MKFLNVEGVPVVTETAAPMATGNGVTHKALKLELMDGSTIYGCNSADDCFYVGATVQAILVSHYPDAHKPGGRAAWGSRRRPSVQLPESFTNMTLADFLALVDQIDPDSLTDAEQKVAEQLNRERQRGDYWFTLYKQEQKISAELERSLRKLGVEVGGGM